MERRATRRQQATNLAVAAAATLCLAVAAAACGDDDDGGGDGAAATIEAPAGTSAGGGTGGDAASGEQLARSMGCAGCHGQDFGGGAGPPLVGLAGAEVPLADGTTVVADTAYLIRSIADPGAELVADYNLRMPANNLSDAEIADIVAYIETLADG
jgi:cytochrome c oxidase subunit 2